MVNMLANKRLMVKGDGPGRQFLPNLKLIGTMSEDFLTDTLELIRNTDPDHNDIFDMESYGLAKQCKLAVGVNGENVEETFCVKDNNTRHIMLQEPMSADVGLYEKGYTKPIANKEHIIKHVKSFLKDKGIFYRGRISVLTPGTNVPKHIDTNTSVSVRLNFLTQGLQEFFVERRGIVESVIMKPGDVYFINQGWRHWVKNLSDIERITILISCDWGELKPYFTLQEDGKTWI